MKTLISGVLFGFILLVGCGNPQSGASQTKHSDKTIYSCPMHHEVREEKPGQCLQCGMDLLAVDDISQW